MKPSVDYREWLLKRLKADHKYALGYLNECLHDGDIGVFLLALKDVTDAFGGVAELARKTKLSREHLFRMLSKNGNPRLENLQILANAFGWQISFSEKRRSKFKKAA